MFDIASSTSIVTTAYANIGTLILLTVGTVMGAWAALVGLGFAKRKATRYVTGKHF